MRSRSNGGVIGAYALPNQNYANGVFFIHDAAIFNTGPNPIWPLASGVIVSATGGTISTAADNSNYRTHTFTSNTTFTVVNGSGLMEILLVGGGGGGGSARSGDASAHYQSGGGGGGGGVTLVNTWVNPGTTFTITVGPGAINPQTSITGEYDGGASSVTSTAGHNYIASGGGSGMASYFTVTGAPNSGGSGGGGAARGSGASYNGAAAGGTYTYANAGGNGSASVSTGWNAGGGGGAGTIGYSGLFSSNTAISSRGGDGWLWSRTNAYYGAGGGGGRTYNANPNGSGLGGLTGPSPGQRLGNGGFTSSSTAGTAGTSVSSSHYYGAGGGGATENNSDGNRWGGNGSPGTVIFCYRYR